jgi:RHS repeat-associated protein
MNVYYQYGASGIGNQSGRLIAQQDASGMQTFEYGNMGELIENIHTFVVPGGDAYTFQTKWDYDSWNRVIGIYYPDGEYVSYEYDNGGKLIAMSGLKNSITYDYIDDVRYDKFGSRTRIDYGNGTYSLYSYHPQNRRLTNLQSYEMSTLLMHDLYYYYDDAGNITGQGNYGNYVNGNTGGVYESSYSYDDLYRLSSSAGYFSSYYNGYRQFDLEMSYSPSGNIVSKTQNAQTLINGNQVLISYDNDYYYYGKPHAVSVAGNYAFKWDLNGNMVARGISGGERYQCWDEENRLTAVRDVAELSQLSVYLYDGGGERAWKLTGQEMETKLSGKGVYTNVSFDKTLYSSPLMVVTDKEYSKHYFIEGERVCTKIGGGFWGTAQIMPNGTPVGMLYGTLPEFTYNLSVMTGRHIECTGYAGQWDISPSFAHLLNKTNMPESNQYFYHSDHLGSASFVTDATGYVDQHIQYLPFGELFISQRNSTFDSRYKFTAKELDNETQYTYFGARYLDSDISIWLSVDPSAELYPSLSPYNYCGNNPTGNIDSNGEWFFGLFGSTSAQRQAARRDAAYRGGEINNYYKRSINVTYEFSRSEANPYYSESSPNTSASIYSHVNQTIKYSKDGVRIGYSETTNNIINEIIDSQMHFASRWDSEKNMPIPQPGTATNIDGEIFMMVAPLPKIGKIIKESFSKNLYIYRAFGGEAKALGKSWTPTNPIGIDDYRNFAGLPKTNTGQFVIEGTTKRSNILIERQAIPLHGNQGGMIEYVIKNPNKININRVSGVNPEF